MLGLKGDKLGAEHAGPTNRYRAGEDEQGHGGYDPSGPAVWPHGQGGKATKLKVSCGEENDFLK